MPALNRLQRHNTSSNPGSIDNDWGQTRSAAAGLSSLDLGGGAAGGAAGGGERGATARVKAKAKVKAKTKELVYPKRVCCGSTPAPPSDGEQRRARRGRAGRGRARRAW